MIDDARLDQDGPGTRPVGPGFQGFDDLAQLERSLERRDPLLRVDRRGPGPRPQPEGGEVARELAHDLRQPLAAARALLSAVTGDVADASDVVRARLDLLARQLEQVSETVASALQPSPPRLVGLVAVCRDCCTTAGAASGTPVELVVDASPVVAGDAAQLRRLVGNLLANAARAAGPDGTVRLRVSARRGTAVLEVEDSGQPDGGPGTGPSTGLGLLVVDGIVRRHGGTLDSAASELGGLRLTVTLPTVLPVQEDGG